VDWNITKTD